MLRQDKIWVGAFTALVFPLFFFVIYYELNDLMVEKNLLPGIGVRLQFICIISVVMNVIPAGAYVRTKRDNALRGTVGITLLYVFGIVIFFYKSLVTG